MKRSAKGVGAVVSAGAAGIAEVFGEGLRVGGGSHTAAGAVKEKSKKARKEENPAAWRDQGQVCEIRNYDLRL